MGYCRTRLQQYSLRGIICPMREQLHQPDSYLQRRNAFRFLRQFRLQCRGMHVVRGWQLQRRRELRQLSRRLRSLLQCSTRDDPH